jgi:hypothetical protein
MRLDFHEQHKLASAITILVVSGLIAASALIKGQVSGIPKETFKLTGLACAYKNNVLLGCKYNRIVDTGEEWLELAVRQGGVGTQTYLALGNTSAPTETDSSLPGEITDCGLTRSAATVIDNGNGNWTLKKTWVGQNYGGTISCDGVTINTTGVYNASSDGTFFAGTSVASAIVSKRDNYTIEYTFWIGEEA